jgi:hypothetical protein
MRYRSSGFMTAYVLADWLIPRRPFLADMPASVALRAAAFRALVGTILLLTTADMGGWANPLGAIFILMMSVATAWNLIWALVMPMIVVQIPRIRRKSYGITQESPEK